MIGGGGNCVSVVDVELPEEVDDGFDVDDGALVLLEVDDVEETEVLEVLVSIGATLVVVSSLEVDSCLLLVLTGLLQPETTKPVRIAKNNNCFFIMT